MAQAYYDLVEDKELEEISIGKAERFETDMYERLALQ